MDDSGIGAIPLGEGGIGTSWDVPKLGTGDNLEEGVAHGLEIRFEFFLNVDNESGCDRGEQTGLSPRKNQINTTVEVEAEKGLTKINVVFKSPSYLFIKSWSYSSASR